MKNLILPLYMCLFIMLISCKPGDTPNPTPEKKKEYTLKFISTEIVDFKEIAANKNIRDLDKDKVPDYFKERMEFATPKELQFKNDSLYVVKPENMMEKYKIQWKNDELYLHNPHTDAWKYCGKEAANGRFILNTAFFSIASKTDARFLQIVGQDHSFKSYTDLDAAANSSTIWLQTHTLFGQK